MMKTPVSRKTSLSTRLAASLLLVSLTAAPCYAGLKEGLAAYGKADYATAVKELTPVAQRGDAKAQTTLGKIYGLGQGVPKDSRASAEWFLKAAEQGVAEALKRAKDGIVEWLGRENLSKGVQIRSVGDMLDVDLFIIVEYGISIAEVCKTIVDTVRYKLESMTGVKVRKVNISVEGIRV